MSKRVEKVPVAKKIMFRSSEIYFFKATWQKWLKRVEDTARESLKKKKMIPIGGRIILKKYGATQMNPHWVLPPASISFTRFKISAWTVRPGEFREDLLNLYGEKIIWCRAGH